MAASATSTAATWATWTATSGASTSATATAGQLGLCTSSPTCGSGQLKFLYAPDLVKAGDRDMVLIGSGDREKPLAHHERRTSSSASLDCEQRPDNWRSRT